MRCGSFSTMGTAFSRVPLEMSPDDCLHLLSASVKKRDQVVLVVRLKYEYIPALPCRQALSPVLLLFVLRSINKLLTYLLIY